MSSFDPNQFRTQIAHGPVSYLSGLRHRLITRTRTPLSAIDRNAVMKLGSIEIWRDGEYVCCIAPNEILGAKYYCGYVGVPIGHVMHGDSPSYRFVNVDDMNIHGGITWCDTFKEIEPEFWFYGFDMSHSSDLDLSPGQTPTAIAKPHVTFDTAMEETARLLNHVKCWIQWF